MKKIDTEMVEMERGRVAEFAGEIVNDEIVKAIGKVHTKIKVALEADKLSPEAALVFCIEINSWRGMGRKLSYMKKKGGVAAERLTPEM